MSKSSAALISAPLLLRALILTNDFLPLFPIIPRAQFSPENTLRLKSVRVITPFRDHANVAPRRYVPHWIGKAVKLEASAGEILQLKNLLYLIGWFET